MKFNPADLIINRPDLVTSGHKLTAWGITLLFWGVLLYLWQPLLSIIAWGLNIRLFYNHMVLLGGYRTFLQLLAGYLQIIALLGGGLIVWARINQWRFRNNERRLSLGDTDVQQLHKTFGVTAAELAAASHAQIIKFSFAANGNIETITTSPRMNLIIQRDIPETSVQDILAISNEQVTQEVANI